jgi:GR25 family glycosyltransferase involved in LPS biosynthesis
LAVTYRVVKKIGARNSPDAFILVDDASLASDAPENLTVISARPPERDMLKLFSDKPNILVRPDEPTDGYVFGVPEKHPMSTIAYAVTRQAVAAIAKNSIPFDLPVDLALKHWWNHQACVKLVQPNLCVLDSNHMEFSSIGKHRNIEKENVILKLFLRNIHCQLRFNLASFLRRDQQPMKPCC